MSPLDWVNKGDITFGLGKKGDISFRLGQQSLCHFQYDPSTCSAQKTGGQQEEGHRVVHHVQGEHHQSYVLQTPLFLDKFSRKDMVEQSHNTP